MSTRRTPRDTTAWCPDCGYTSPRTTRRLAAHGLRSHSCERHRKLAAARAAGDARRAQYGTVIRDCTHDGRHPHGDRNCYILDRCRCAPCSRAQVAYERTRTRQKAYGRWQPYVDAEPARQHVRALMAAGMGWKRIGHAADVSGGAMTKLLYGTAGTKYTPSRRIRPDAAARLLAVQLDLAPAALVDAHGSWLRLQALVAIGYPQAHLAEMLGRSRALQFGRDQLEVATAEQVRDLYERLWSTPGPSSRAVAFAARQGWATPLELDDDRIDDPTYTPTLHRLDDVAERRQQRELIAERRQQVLDLLDRGLDAAEVARRLGISADLVQSDRRRARRAS